MKTTFFPKKIKQANEKSLLKFMAEKEIMPLTNSELNHLKGGEGEEVTVIRPK
jgi:hypothetical protein